MAKIREIDTPEKFKELLKKGNIDLGEMPLEEAYKQFRKIAETDPNAPVTEMSDEELEATTGGELITGLVIAGAFLISMAALSLPAILPDKSGN